MELTVARIGRAHGLRGEVRLDVRTDRPDLRLAVGERLATRPAQAGPLTVAYLRNETGAWIVGFAEVADRTEAEALNGVELVVQAREAEEADAWYPHELRGLAVVLPDGTPAGTVLGLETGAAQDLLLIDQGDGTTALVPFVTDLVPVVDTAGGRVVVDPPRGLLAVRPAPEDQSDDAPRPGSGPGPRSGREARRTGGGRALAPGTSGPDRDERNDRNDRDRDDRDAES